MGRTACTEPQCLHKGALYLYLYLTGCLNNKTFASAAVCQIYVQGVYNSSGMVEIW